MKLASLVLLLAVPQPTGFLEKTIDYNKTPTKYAVYVPPTYSDKKAHPAILFLHGVGEQGTDGKRQLDVGLAPAIKANPDAWDFIAIFPQKPPQGATWMDHEKLILEIVEKTAREYKIDETRLYVTGLSLGGVGTWGLLSKYPNMFAAAAPICGAGDPSSARRIKVPTWIFHGEKDKIIPLAKAKDMADGMKNGGTEPKLTIYPDAGHNIWDKAYRDEKLGEWFLQFPPRKKK